MYLDANVFIYATLDTGKEGKAARALVRKLESGSTSGAVSPLVLDEVAWVLKRAKGMGFAVKAWREIMQIPNLKILPMDESASLRVPQLMEAGLKPRDAMHAAIMLENAITTIISSDNDFDKIASIHRQKL
jgi:predicted nucleic acid-binding protein